MRAALVVAALVLLAACSPDDDETLTVFAAASLTDAFTAIGDRFEDEHPDIDVVFSFAGSQQLVAQVAEGADADVVATADQESMRALDLRSTVFATNSLAIFVEPGNPLRIEALGDLARDDVTLVLAAPEVPAGRYAAAALEAAGVEATPKSFEENVKAVVTRVALGEADAGIAYVSDLLVAADDVESISIPLTHNVVARYPFAAEPGDPLAAAFVDLVLGEEGQLILLRHGFGER